MSDNYQLSSNLNLNTESEEARLQLQNRTDRIVRSGKLLDSSQLIKALEKNITFQRVIRKNIRSLDNLLEANDEKRRVVWQAISQVRFAHVL
jgi:hypothetical protein